MIKKLGVIIVCCLIFRTGYAQTLQVEKSGVYLRDYSLSELQNELEELGYNKFLYLGDKEYPRIFVETLPKDFDSVENKTIRNQLFMQIMLPHILKINQEFLQERKKLLALRAEYEKNLDLDEQQCAYIEDQAKKYDVTTPFKDSRRCPKLLNGLIDKVDALPPSIVVAAAAIYTKWGTSRIALEGNNLFKTRNWYSEEGLEPIGEDKSESYRYKIYPSIEDSIRDYMFKVNTDVNFHQFRTARRLSHKRGDILYGKRLAWAFVLENNLTNFAGMLDYTITFYRLTFYDEATLEAEYDFVD